MNRFIPFLIPILFVTEAFAIKVIDPTLIATNKANAAKEYAESLIRKANQVKQIQQQLEQILQMTDYLKRYGHPDVAVAEAELKRLQELLTSIAPSKSATRINEGVSGNEIFSDEIQREIILDGTKEIDRNPEIYREQAKAKRGFDHYHHVQAEVLKRRQDLRQSIASTTSQMQAATTESEIRKLSAILTAQQTELAAIDKEMDFAASEIMARHLKAEHDKRLRAKARIETDRARHRKAMRQDAKFYRLLTRPVRFR